MEEAGGGAPAASSADSAGFLEVYFRKRGIEPLEESAVHGNCVKRAEEARAEFKRQKIGDLPALPRRKASSADPTEIGNMTDPDNAQEVKKDAVRYNRRLHNNRKSAAAAKIYQEVLRAEQAHELRRMSSELIEMKEKFSKMQQDATDMRTILRRMCETQSDGQSATINQAPAAVHENVSATDDALSTSTSFDRGIAGLRQDLISGFGNEKSDEVVDEDDGAADLVFGSERVSGDHDL